MPTHKDSRSRTPSPRGRRNRTVSDDRSYDSRSYQTNEYSDNFDSDSDTETGSYARSNGN